QDALDKQACAVDGERALRCDGVGAGNGVESVAEAEPDTGDEEHSTQGSDEAGNGDDELKPIAHRSGGERLDQDAEYGDTEDDEDRHQLGVVQVRPADVGLRHKLATVHRLPSWVAPEPPTVGA